MNAKPEPEQSIGMRRLLVHGVNEFEYKQVDDDEAPTEAAFSDLIGGIN